MAFIRSAFQYNAHRVWTYRTTDAYETVTAPGYWSGAYDILQTGDRIVVSIVASSTVPNAPVAALLQSFDLLVTSVTYSTATVAAIPISFASSSLFDGVLSSPLHSHHFFEDFFGFPSVSASVIGAFTVLANKPSWVYYVDGHTATLSGTSTLATAVALVGGASVAQLASGATANDDVFIFAQHNSSNLDLFRLRLGARAAFQATFSGASFTSRTFAVGMGNSVNMVAANLTSVSAAAAGMFAAVSGSTLTCLLRNQAGTGVALPVTPALTTGAAYDVEMLWDGVSQISGQYRLRPDDSSSSRKPAWTSLGSATVPSLGTMGTNDWDMSPMCLAATQTAGVATLRVDRLMVSQER